MQTVLRLLLGAVVTVNLAASVHLSAAQFVVPRDSRPRADSFAVRCWRPIPDVRCVAPLSP
jgi:hypothetical protein